MSRALTHMSLPWERAGRAPSSFPQERMRVDVSSLALPPRLAALIEGLLEPLEEDRMSSADALITLTQPADALERHALPNLRCPGQSVCFVGAQEFQVQLKFHVPEHFLAAVCSMLGCVSRW